MPKTKQQKQEAVQSLADDLKKAKAAVFANFQGLTVEESQDLRGKCRQEGVNVLAAKKTLVKRVCDEIGLEGADPANFDGGVATFVGTEDETAAARIVNNFAKDHEIVKIFGGVLEGKYISDSEVKNLANLPTSEAEN